MAKIAILGMGMMGAGMADCALRKGNSVTVWNRTPAKARAVEKIGATFAETPTDAVRDAERVHLILSDDAAVDSVLAQALPALTKQTQIIDHTTVSPTGTIARRRWCDEHGLWFLHAPVFMSPKACHDGTGIILCSGPADRFEAVKPALEAMTGFVWYLGDRIDLAASFKLLGNTMILSVVAGLADVFELGKSLGVKATDAHALFSHLKVGGTVDIRGGKMAQGDFTPAFELAMARKDLRLMLEAASDPAKLTVLPALASRCDEYLSQGFGDRDVGVIARNAVASSGSDLDLDPKLDHAIGR